MFWGAFELKNPLQKWPSLKMSSGSEFKWLDVRESNMCKRFEAKFRKQNLDTASGLGIISSKRELY